MDRLRGSALATAALVLTGAAGCRRPDATPRTAAVRTADHPAAPTPAPAPAAAMPVPVLEEAPPGADVEALRRAAEPYAGAALLGAARVERLWRWRPPAAEELLVWATCRGAGDSRACVLAVAAPPLAAAAPVRLLAHEPAGWSVPRLAVDPADGSRLPADGSRLPADGSRLPADGSRLVISGDDGRGPWRQILRRRAADGASPPAAVTFEPKRYDDR